MDDGLALKDEMFGLPLQLGGGGGIVGERVGVIEIIGGIPIVGVRVGGVVGGGVPPQSRISANALFVSLLSSIRPVESRLMPMYGEP